MSTISDQLPQSGRPPMLSQAQIEGLESEVKQASVQELTQDFEYQWTIYLTDGGTCSFEDLLAAFQDLYEFITDESVIENSLIGNTGSGFYLQPANDWDGNPKDGLRRAVDIHSGGLTNLHFSCWIAEEWQGNSTLSARFELPIRIKTNLDWENEYQIWQFIAQRFGKIGYKDSTLTTIFKDDLIKRLEKYPDLQKNFENQNI